MYYHLMVQKSKKSKRFCVYDLTKTELKELYVDPLLQKNKVLVNGFEINDIHSVNIQIISTDKKVDSIVKIKNKNNDIPALKFYRPDIFNAYDDISYKFFNFSTVNRTQQERNEDKFIFIVHGRDEEMRKNVYNFLKEKGYRPIVLKQECSGGATIIEKIESWGSKACFGVVLYSPDDEGKLKSDSKLNDRGRQNVVFEHGYLIANLGRNRVCHLVKGDIEIPSDISGVVSIKYARNSDWRNKLINEMKEMGV